MIRASSHSSWQFCLWAAAAFCLPAGCVGSASALQFETTSELPLSEPRRPPAVAVDPEPEVPEPSPDGEADRALLVLTPPVDLSAAYQVIQQFFEAVLREDIARLEELLEADASLELDPQGGKRRASALWRSRLSQIEYDRVPSQELYRESQIESYRKADVERLAARTRAELSLESDDVVLRVPLLVTKLDKVRIFGDEILFVLRPSGRSFKIAEMVEPFQLQ